MEAVYAGNVGDQRNTILLLGLGIAILGTAVFCSAPRLLLVASAFLGAVTFFVSRGVIQDVRAVTEDDSELVTESDADFALDVLWRLMETIYTTPGRRDAVRERRETLRAADQAANPHVPKAQS